MAEKAGAKEKTPTSEDFITSWPLYTPFQFEDYDPPARISFHCFGAHCGKETTWVLSGKTWVNNISPTFYHVHYQCNLCQKTNLVVCYAKAGSKTRQTSGPHGPHSVAYYTHVLKIGQYPALSINIAPALQKNLGEGHTALYKKALANRNEGYGLGAVSYIRRVIEDKTEELIEVVAQLAEAQQIDTETVKKIRAAKDEKTTYDNKLKIASTILPRSLLIDGANPLDALFGLVSAGLHDLTEEQCIAIADETKSVFEFTFTRLRAETKERQDFAAKVKKWAGGDLPAVSIQKTRTAGKIPAEPLEIPKDSERDPT